MIKPILVMFTSHRMDCMALSLSCLDKYVGSHHFKKMYFIANEVSCAHLKILKGWCSGKNNAEIIYAIPRGIVPGVMMAFNNIMSIHKNDVIVKIDEDIFVTKDWLPSIIENYIYHSNNDDILLSSSLAPLSATGWECMRGFYEKKYNSEYNRVCEYEKHYADNRRHHRFIWDSVLNDNLCEKYYDYESRKYIYLDSVIINCIVFDQRLIDAVYPIPLTLVDNYVPDEKVINKCLQNGKKVAYATYPLVHHYSHSHAYCQLYLNKHVPIPRIWRHLIDDDRHETGKSM
jgi:hypothetical protein